MATFTVRVELHDADDDDYDVLHNEMSVRGFSRVIVGDKGVAYHLPTAEYDYEGDIATHTVRAKARAAADETGKKNAVLVTESLRRSWIGLDRV